MCGSCQVLHRLLGAEPLQHRVLPELLLRRPELDGLVGDLLRVVPHRAVELEERRPGVQRVGMPRRPLLQLARQERLPDLARDIEHLGHVVGHVLALLGQRFRVLAFTHRASPPCALAPCDHPARRILTSGPTLAQKERMPRRPVACIALLAAACAPEPGAPPPPTAATLAAPAPRLAETARFDAALSAADPRRRASGGRRRRARRPGRSAARPRRRARAAGDARRRAPAARSHPSLIPGTSFRERRCPPISRRRSSGTGAKASQGDMLVNSIIYLVGLIVIVLAVLSLVGIA